MAVSAFALAALLSPLAALQAAAQIEARQGDLGAVVLPIYIEDDSPLAAEGVSVATSHAGGFEFNQPARVGPLTLDPGTTYYFEVPFEFAADLNFGAVELTATLLTQTTSIEIDAAQKTVTLSYGIEESVIEGPDASAPITDRVVTGNSALRSAGTFIDGTATISFNAFDPIRAQAATSGVSELRYLVDETFVDTATTPGTIFADPFTLQAGPHTISFFSIDAAANHEPVNITELIVDDASPMISNFSISEGQIFTQDLDNITPDFSVSDDNDALPRFEAFFVLVEDRGVPIGSGLKRIGFFPGNQVPASSLDDGVWELQVSATDFVRNSTYTYSPRFEIRSNNPDSLPPRTTLTIGNPQALPFISAQTPLSLSAVDDLETPGDGLGIGVARTEYAIDGGAPILYASPFTISAEGPRDLSYFSTDLAGNAEAVQLSSVTVDATPPVLSFSVEASSLTDRLGRLIVSTSTVILLSAADALSGVASIAYSIDGGPEVLVQSTGASVVIPQEGNYRLSFYAQDRVENRSVAFSTTVIVDVSPPSFGALSVSGGDGGSGSETAAISTTSASVQIAVSDAASGLDVAGSGSGPSPLSAISGTLGLWHFDEPSGNIALNAGGPAGDGIINSNVTRAAGILGGAVRVGPNPTSTPNAGVTLGSQGFSAINSLPAGTVELWAKLLEDSTIGNMSHIFTVKQTNGSDSEFLFSVTLGQTMNLWHPANHVNDCTSPIVIDPSHWYHFTATWDETSEKIYVDGQLAKSCSPSSALRNNTSPSCLSIAGGCGDSAQNGERLIDEVRVLNFALSPEEIALNAFGSAKSFSARLSVDGGESFSSLDGVSLSGDDGDTSSQVLSASGLALKPSTGPADTNNLIEFTARDMSGRAASARRVILVNLNPTTPPRLSAPAASFSSSVSLVGFSWLPGEGVPEISISGYEIQFARDADFTQNLTTLSPSTHSTTTSLPEGESFWRVAALDRFGDRSPYSLKFPRR